ncbi:MAG: UDP-N-acetylmuramoyl-L-alanine--D-glutamate ligase [Candidatus Buchananbacteria bacterium]
MIKPKYFEFTSYKIEPVKNRISFGYKIEFLNSKPLLFTEILEFPKPFKLDKIPAQLLKNSLANLHLILGISYFKLYCPPEFKMKYKLNKEGADFWHAVYQKGLGEFLYQNKLDPKIIPQFPSQKKSEFESVYYQRKSRSLVGIGGGKDSLVVAELMKENKMDFTGWIVETNFDSQLIKNVISKLDIDSLKIKRLLDRKIFEKHPDSFNGHIPISAVLAFIGVLTGIIYDYKNIVVSNEYSSNFGNIKYKGLEINHQWSKSAEFEKMFQDYCKKYIAQNVNYFSALRPFYEIRIAELLSKYPKYLSTFSSCNRNFKISGHSDKLWCGECPKCIYTFLLLSAFLSKEKLVKIFGKNLFDDLKLLSLFKDVLGWGKMKPFDCVGTFDEARAALYLAKDKYKNESIVKELSKFEIKNPEQLLKKVFGTYQSEAKMPTAFKFLGIKNVLIVGYGNEGKVTKKYLSQKYPKLKIGIADQKDGDNYLKKQSDFDLAIKTPGIPKEKISIPYTTATNLFFSQIKNLTIGITGTKGKSTTASLIYDILKTAGKKVRLLGNIGNPMLEVLSKPIDPKEVFVLELSSYQLDDLEFSPNIAVVLNLFPEHMNYHGNIDKYYIAKKNIINYQGSEDYFIYNSKFLGLKEWAKDSAAKKVIFEKESLNFDSKLLGEHNKSNILAAAKVAKILKISDTIIKRAVLNFQPLPHRLEFVGEFKKIKFYDDAISTTPESTIMAIKSLPKIGTIFLGGEDRGYDFKELEKEVIKAGIKNVVLFPETGKRMFKNGGALNILRTNKMEEAVKFAYKNTKPGEICLLSTASPSYSLWKNFEEKGSEFKKAVKKLK